MNTNDTFRSLADSLEPFIQPIIAETVTQTLIQIENDEAQLGNGRLWFSESEAAGLLGLPAHRLRDCRRRGEITGCKVGKSIGYERDELLRFLRNQRIEN